MKRENISKVIGNLNDKHISEAENYTSSAKRYSIKSFFIIIKKASSFLVINGISVEVTTIENNTPTINVPIVANIKSSI